MASQPIQYEASSDPAGPSPKPGTCPPELFTAVYDRLRAIAESRMVGERTGHTLQATALVHEAYLRLMAMPGFDWSGPRQFYGAAAESMRRILIDHARKKKSQKRSNGKPMFELSENDVGLESDQESILALDEALTRLKERDERMHEIVMLRYFAGQTIERTAEILGVSPRTAKRDWTVARAWLRTQLMGHSEPQ